MAKRKTTRSTEPNRVQFDAMVRAGSPQSVARLVYRLREVSPSNPLMLEAAVGLEDLADQLQLQQCDRANAVIADVVTRLRAITEEVASRLVINRADAQLTRERQRRRLARSLYDGFEACTEGGR